MSNTLSQTGTVKASVNAVGSLNGKISIPFVVGESEVSEEMVRDIVAEYMEENPQSGDVWETINEAVVEDVVMTELDCNFDDYKKVAIMLDGFGTKTAGRVNAHFGYADSDTTNQICQFIDTTDDKRYGYILIDTVLGQIVYTASTDWAHDGCNLMTLTDGLSVHNHIGATKVKIIAIDSGAGGANPSTSNTMMGKIKIVGVRK